VTLKDLPGTEPDVSYIYDNLGRMTSATLAGHALSFTYDALGRKLTEANSLGTATFAYSPANQITQTVRTGDTYAFTPLASGTTTRRPSTSVKFGMTHETSLRRPLWAEKKILGGLAARQTSGLRRP